MITDTWCLIPVYTLILGSPCLYLLTANHVIFDVFDLTHTQGSCDTILLARVNPLQIYCVSYLGFYVAFNTVQIISRRVVGRAEETSIYSLLGFCTVNCRPTANNYQLSHLRPCRESNPGLRGGRRVCYHSATVAPKFTVIHNQQVNENIGDVRFFIKKCLNPKVLIMFLLFYPSNITLFLYRAQFIDQYFVQTESLVQMFWKDFLRCRVFFILFLCCWGDFNIHINSVSPLVFEFKSSGSDVQL